MEVVKKEYDGIIIDLIRDILGDGAMVVETVNESLLVKFMELRGTPIEYKKAIRNIDEDFAREYNANKMYIGIDKSDIKDYTCTVGHERYTIGMVDDSLEKKLKDVCDENDCTITEGLNLIISEIYNLNMND